MEKEKNYGEYSSIKNKKREDSFTSDDKEITKRESEPGDYKYPYCLVWSPIYVFSWIIPIIGHAGVCSSDGTVYEYGPDYIEKEKLPFGNPTKYVLLKLNEKEKENYDKILKETINIYNNKKFTFCCNNCHAFPAGFLNNLNYQGRSNYNVVSIWWIFLTQGR